MNYADAVNTIRQATTLDEIVAALRAFFAAKGRAQEGAFPGPQGYVMEVRTAKGTKLETQFTVLEAADLIASHTPDGRENPAFPQELQPRDRSRKSSQLWITKTANDLDPGLLGRTKKADSGAPIIGPDRIVESGNGRALAIMEAYRIGKADEYKEWLVEDADSYGLDAQQIAAMRAPVLVRVRLGTIDRRTFAVEANQDDKLAMTATEKAAVDANRLTPALLEKFAPGEDGDLLVSSNREFILGFLRSLGEAEAAQYLTSTGDFTGSLIARLQAAIFAKAYQDERLLELMADSAKPENRNVLNALNASAAEFIRARSINEAKTQRATEDLAEAVEMSLEDEAVKALIDATNIVRAAKRENMAVDLYVEQMGLFDQRDPAVSALAVFIAQNNRSAKRLAVAFKAMADFVRKEAERGQNMDILGEATKISLVDIVQAANRKLEEVYGQEGQRTIGDAPIFEAALTDEEDAEYAAIRRDIGQATTFPQLVAAMLRYGEFIGADVDSTADLQARGQFGLRRRGQKARKELNAKAREIIARVGDDPSKLTDADRDVLQQYSGRGGIADDNSLSEYYTPTPIAEGVWEMLAANGFANGNVLEPSTGPGVFAATKPKGTKISGAEIDETSSSVARLLFPDEDINQQSFEQLCAVTPDDTFDSVIGNVPFGDTRGKWAQYDGEYQNIKEMERYFVTRAVDKCKPGGLIALIVPPNIVGKKSKTFNAWRRDLSRKAEFLGAHKLPSGTFGGANGNGTDTVVDVLLLRKHSTEVAAKVNDVSTETLEQAQVYFTPWIQGKWFETAEGKRFVHGEVIEGFRTVVKANIDNVALKQKLARKFTSRIDFGLLQAAETITRNYAEGDRRMIGGQTHEYSNGEWVKLDAVDGIGADDALDATRYGVDSQAQLLSILQGSALDALQLQFSHAHNAISGAFARDAGGFIKNAVHAAQHVPPEQQERVYRAALIGQAISQYARAVQEEGHDTARLEQLQRLVVAEMDRYGFPGKDATLKGVSGPGAAGVGAFMRAVRADGGFSDLLAGMKDGTRGSAYDAHDPADIVRFLSVQRGNGKPVTLEDVQGLYAGSETLTLDSLAAHAQIAIDPNGMLLPMHSYTSGHVAGKIHELRMAMSGDVSNALLDKFQSQINEINRKRDYVEADDIHFGLRDNWLSRDLVLEYLKDTGRHVLYGSYDTKDGEAVGFFSNVKQDPFDAQVLNYLNGKPVRSKDKAAAAVYKRQIADLEEAFGVWLRQRDDFDALVEQYNNTFNGYIPAEYDGSDLGLENVADWVKPHDYQAAGVRRLSDEGKGVLAFDVGLGKTLSALALAQYNAQKGRAKRTCILVPKAVLENWYHEARQFHKSLDHLLFIGFTPKPGERAPVLTETGEPKRNQAGEVQYRDVLAEDNDKTIWQKMHDIPQTNKRLVIMSRERFGMIPMRQATREGYADKLVVRNLLSEREADKLSDKSTYKDAKKREQISEKFSADGTGKKDAYPFFEDMGFDSVIVDEAHEYKNSYEAGNESKRLAYLPTPQASDRAIDLAAKMDYLRSQNQGNGPVLLTATPVTNSPVEIYNMLSHVVPPEFFDSMGIRNVDDFVRAFCKIEVVQRTKLSGEVVFEDGVAGFQNLSGLRNLFHRFVNLKTAKDVGENVLKLPDSQEVHDTVDMLPLQAQIYEDLRQEAANIGEEGSRPVFAIIRDMDRVTTDLDLFNRTMTFTFSAADKAKVEALAADLPKTFKRTITDEETGEKSTTEVNLQGHLEITVSDNTLLLVVPEDYESDVVKRLKKFGIAENTVAHPVMPKYAKLLENLRSDYENGGKQIIFTEEKTQHDKLKRLIVHHLSVSADEVGIINADTASGDKLEKTANAFNTGKIKIVIANKKAEVGVNLQKGTTAIHHLTLPWTPASIQQRNGRGVRQGNTAKNIAVHYYLGKGSFDSYRLELLQRKANWINDLFFGDAAEASNANANSDEEMALMLASDPEERRRMIDAYKAREAAKERAFANKRAGIDLANLARHKAMLEEAQRKASDAEWQAANQERIERAKQQTDKLIARLRSEASKNRIDYDVDQLVSGEVPYALTPKGHVVVAGQVYSKKDSNGKDIFALVVSIAPEDKTIVLASSAIGGRQSRTTATLEREFTPTILPSAEIFEKFAVEEGMTYSQLQGLPMEIDDAFLREQTPRAVEKGFMFTKHCIITDLQGNLRFFNAWESGAKIPEGFALSRPKPDNPQWRERGLRAVLAAHRANSDPGIRDFAQSLFGMGWREEALKYSNNLIPESVVMDILAAVGARFLAEAQTKYDAALQPFNPQEIDGVTLATKHMDVDVRRTSLKEMAESQYDFDEREITLKYISPYLATEFVPKLNAITQAVRDKLTAIKAAQNAEREAKDAAEKADQKAKQEALQASLSQVIPSDVLRALNDLGLQVSLNAMRMKWTPYKAKEAVIAEPGTYLVLFDPKGYGGPLSKAFQGQHDRNRKMGAVWNKDLKSWIMPIDGLDYDALLGAFD